MTTTQLIGPAPDFAELLELQAKIWREFNELVKHDPDSAQSLLKRLTAKAGPDGGRSNWSAKKSSDGRDGSPVFLKVARLYMASGNAPLTKQELVQAAGMTKGALHTLLYTTRPDSFARAKKRGVVGKVFSLSPEGLAEAQRA